MKHPTLSPALKRLHKLCAVSVLTFIGTVSTYAETPDIAVGLQPAIRIEGKEPDYSTLKERMEHHRVPSVSIAFLQNHKIVWAHTEGFANKENNTAVNANTVFQSASISKPTFATVLLQYRQKHGLDIDADVNALLKSWQLPDHEWQETSPVTLRRLLSHSAGTTVHGFRGYAAGEKVPTILEVLQGSGPANSAAVVVDIKPGTRFRYSGGGTTLAQLVLENVSGLPLPEIAQKSLFTPLGMTRSSFEQPLATHLTDNAATPYQLNGQPVEGGAHTYATLAAAGLWTTPSDLLLLGAAIQRSYLGIDETILNQENAREMLTVQQQPVGLGFFLEGEGETLAFSHGGSNQGFRSYLYLHANRGDGIAIMTNSDNGTPLMNEIFARAAELYGWENGDVPTKKLATLADKQIARLAGTYKGKDNAETSFTIVKKGDTLIVNATDRIIDMAFFPESENTFFSQEGPSLSFSFDDEGNAISLLLNGYLAADKTE